MTGTDLAVTGGTLAVHPGQSEWTEAQQAALAQLGVAEASRGDQLVFLHVAQKMGLDPFAGEIFMIGRWDGQLQRKKWTIQIGIEGFRKKSEEHPDYVGSSGPEWCGPDGEWRDVWLSDEPPVAARFTVFRQNFPEPVIAVVHYREYVQKKADGTPVAMWKNMPASQLGKCCESAARRKAFPRRFGGVYAPEELQHLDNPQPVVVEAERVEAAEPDWDALITAAETAASRDELAKVWTLARGLRPNDGELLNRIAETGERIKKASSGPGETQTNRLFALLGDGGVSGTDRSRRIHLADRILRIEGRAPAQPVTSFKDLSAADTDTINDFLQHHRDIGDLIHTLAELGAELPSESSPAE